MKSLGCVLIGHAQQRLSEGLRDWLQASFEHVFIVADRSSLLDGAHKLKPALILAESALAASDLGGLAAELRQATPGSRILLICHGPVRMDAVAALRPGRDGILRTESLAGDLAVAVDDVLAGRPFTAPAPTADPDARPRAIALVGR